jgi:hypothetical protein
MRFYVIAILLVSSVGLNVWQFNHRPKIEMPMDLGYRTSISGTDKNDTGWCSDDGKNWWRARLNFMCYEADKQYGTTKNPGRGEDSQP